MTKFIDISVPLTDGMVAWPTSPGFRISRSMEMAAGQIANNSIIHTDVHIGTHVDAPWHSIPDGATVERMELASLIGPVWVADLGDADAVTAPVLERAKIPADTRRLLLRTRNSEFWKRGEKKFREDFVGLVPDASDWIVNRGIVLVGTDYLSVQKYSEKSMETHDILLRRNVVIVEGLNLSEAAQGSYQLICLPLKIAGAEGAPARAVLQIS